MSDYEIIRLALGTGILTTILKLIYNRISSDISSAHKKISVIEQEIRRIEIETSKNYLEKEEFKYTFDVLSKRFEKIIDKLENKENKK
jgi:hypothetical protein